MIYLFVLKAVFKLLYGIATMPKPALRIRWCHPWHNLWDRGIERLAGPRVGVSQGGFDRRSTGLDGRQGRCIRRPVEKTRPTAGQGVLDSNGFVGAQVLHDDHRSRTPRWTPHALPSRAEDRRAGRTGYRHDRLEALDAQGPWDRHSRPLVLGHATDDPPAPGGAARQSAHRQLDARCIPALQPPYLQPSAQGAVVRPRLLEAWRMALWGMT
jgi:hypothetical protein